MHFDKVIQKKDKSVINSIKDQNDNGELVVHIEEEIHDSPSTTRKPVCFSLNHKDDDSQATVPCD
jgi:hypothetical protein